MAQVKATYEESTEAKEVAEKLIEKWPDHYGHIDLDKVKFLAINNKNRKEGKKMWEVRAIPDFALTDCPYTHYVVIYLQDWVELSQKFRNLLMADILFAIPDEEGKVKPFDLKGYSPVIRTFGPDFMESDDTLDPLGDDINWRM